MTPRAPCRRRPTRRRHPFPSRSRRACRWGGMRRAHRESARPRESTSARSPASPRALQRGGRARGPGLGVVPEHVGSSGPPWRLRAAKHPVQGGTRMKLHGNAALSWQGRRRMAEHVVLEGWTLKASVQAAGVSVRCCRKWVGRYRLEGAAGLVDRSSAPKRVANRTPQDRIEAIVALRQLRMTAAEIAETLSMALSTVSGILRQRGLGRLGRLGLEQALRYERSRPGELVHVDVKRLGRIQGGAGKRVRGGLRKHWNPARIDAEGRRRLTVGWEFVHIAIDDHSRLAYAEVLPDEKATTAIGFLRRASAFYARYGFRVELLLP